MATGHYRAIYHLKGRKDVAGAVTSNLEELQVLAEGIANHWRSIKGVLIVAHPAGDPLYMYTKGNTLYYVHS